MLYAGVNTVNGGRRSRGPRGPALFRLLPFLCLNGWFPRRGNRSHYHLVNNSGRVNPIVSRVVNGVVTFVYGRKRARCARANVADRSCLQGHARSSHITSSSTMRDVLDQDFREEAYRSSVCTLLR